MQITSKGQVTIPVWAREQYGFLPHTTVEFKVSRSGKIYLVKKEDQSQVRGKKIVGNLRGKLKTTMTTDEIMKFLRS